MLQCLVDHLAPILPRVRLNEGVYSAEKLRIERHAHLWSSHATKYSITCRAFHPPIGVTFQMPTKRIPATMAAPKAREATVVTTALCVGIVATDLAQQPRLAAISRLRSIPERSDARAPVLRQVLATMNRNAPGTTSKTAGRLPTTSPSSCTRTLSLPGELTSTFAPCSSSRLRLNPGSSK